MPRLVHKNPSYRKHRASGKAVVTLNGQDIYLGPHGSKASRDEYDRLIGEWLANGRRSPGPSDSDLVMDELLLQFWEHANAYYRTPDGKQTSEVSAFKELIKLLRKRYGRTAAVKFGPLALKAMQQEMIGKGWCRNSINKQTSRIKHIFKWATENEVIPATAFHALQSVSGLRMGRTAAKESEPVTPVPEAHVYAIKDHVSAQVWAMIELQLVTGMRPGEVCAMRPIDIETSDALWVYRPERHKTQHHGHKREVYLGERAQAIIRPFLNGRATHAHLFSPTEAEASRRDALHQHRKTPLVHGNSPGTNRKRKPARKPGEQYTVTAYRKAITRGCELAFGMPPEIMEPRQAVKADTPEKREARRSARVKWRADHVWHPHQLRHTAATKLRKQYGLEAAQVILGHKTLTVTQIYAEKNVEAAKRIMGEVG